MTLVEVVFALGIVSFCILPLLGLLSIGCNGYNSAIKQSVQADIAQQVRVLAASLNSANGKIPTTYYRADGTATTLADSTGVYEAVVLAPAIPGPNSPAPSVLLANQVQIVYLPSGKVLAYEVIHVTPRLAQQ